MIYRVYSSLDENKEVLADCKDRKIAEKYVEYLKQQNQKSQKKFFSAKRAFTYYNIEEILEDSDILNLTQLHSCKQGNPLD